jgi:hypothetical protein
LTLERKSISEAMIFCIDNAEKAQEIVECLVESITNTELGLNKKVSGALSVLMVRFNQIYNL